MFTDPHHFPAAQTRNARPITTMAEEDAYYRAHTLTAPAWIADLAVLVRHFGHALGTGTHLPVVHRHAPR